MNETTFCHYMNFYENFKELGINTKAENLFSINFNSKGISF